MFKRKTTVDWIFYPWNKQELSNLIKSYFDKIILPKSIYDIKALISPHAWYIYSWEVAAYSYKAMYDNWNKIYWKTIVLLCPSHYVSMNKVAVWLYDKLETPLWDLTVDKDLWNELLNNYDNYFFENYWAFENEHSLEVQLPFLKYIAWSDDIKVLPLIFWAIDYKTIWKILYDFSIKKDVIFIVSSDLSHYKTYDNAIEIDRNTLNIFFTLNTWVISQVANACWIFPWITLNEIAKINHWKPKLLKYLNSWDTAWDKNRVVWYSSVVYL